MSYFPCDIPFMSEDEKKKNGIKCNSDVDKDTNVPSNDTISRQAAIDAMAELQGSTSSKGVLKKISKAWKRIEQLPPANNSEIPNSSDTISRANAIDGKIYIRRSNGVEIYDDYVVPVEYLEQLPPTQPAHDTKVALSLLVDRFENVLSEIREINGDDTVCKWCEYNGAYIGQSGNWDNACPGFDKENCFKLKDSYRKELENING